MWNSRPISHVGLENADHNSSNLRAAALRGKTERKATGGRFGFRVDAAKGYSSPYCGDHFMIMSFGDIPKSGRIAYPESFKLLDSSSQNEESRTTSD
jgi:hypothetical protein